MSAFAPPDHPHLSGTFIRISMVYCINLFFSLHSESVDALEPSHAPLTQNGERPLQQVARKISMIQSSFDILNTYVKVSGDAVAQWVKSWPSGLACPSSSPAQGKIFSTMNRVPLHTAFLLSSAHHPDMTEILLKRT